MFTWKLSHSPADSFSSYPHALPSAPLEWAWISPDKEIGLSPRNGWQGKNLAVETNSDACVKTGTWPRRCDEAAAGETCSMFS